MDSGLSFSVLIEELTNACLPVINAIKNPELFPALLEDLGWDVPDIPEAVTELVDLADSLIEFIEVLTDDDDQFDPDTENSNTQFDYLSLIVLMGEFIETLTSADFVSSLRNQFGEAFLNATSIGDQFFKRLFHYLIITHMEEYHSRYFSILRFLGIFDVHLKEIDADKYQPEYISKTIEFSRIPMLLTDQIGLFEQVYGWGTPQFDSMSLLRNLQDLLNELSIPAGLAPPNPNAALVLHGRDSIEARLVGNELNIPITSASGFSLRFGLNIIEDPDGVQAPGMGLGLYISGSSEISFQITENWKIELEIGGLDQTLGMALVIKPDQPPVFHTNIQSENPIEGGSFKIRITFESPASGRTILFGSVDGPRLEIGSWSVSAMLGFENNQFDAGFDLEVLNSAVVITAGEGDGFIKKILPEGEIESKFDIGLGWSLLDGFYFRGSATLEVTLPIHLELGPISLEELFISLALDSESSSIPIVLAISAKAQIGPVSAVVKKVGVLVDLGFPDDGGNLGPVNLGLGFKWPEGIGISINTEGFTGGGYLECDQINERYAGVLQLSFTEIGLLAITLITTRMPDGSKGFSMLALINVTFSPAITLPYNFNLHGVGGLFGIQRRMDTDVIVEGLKTGIVDSVMFPEGDVIARAPQIISDLRSIFPPTEDRYVIGLMAKLSWSELVFADIGIFIEVPMPIKIVLLGQLYTYLPSEEAPIIELHLDLLGVLDLEQEKLYFMASIYDSRILILDLYGDAYIGISWGSKPYFVLSLGGFHPRDKTVPSDIPSLRRLTLSLGSGNNPRITLKTYLALTSTTLGFGARLDLIAKSGKFSVEGYMGFDALIIFSPFSFEVDIGAGVAIKVGGTTLLSLSLDLLLSGPTPWHAAGTAKFKILFFEVKIKVSATWGSKNKSTLPRLNPWPPLKEALEHDKSWGTAQIGGTPSGVQIKQSEGGVDAVLVYPTGYLEIRQNVLPLDIKINRFRNAEPSGNSNEFSVSSVTAGGIGLNIEPTLDYFARPQYQEMSDSEKLSSPAYEKLNSGVRCKTEDVDAALDDQVEYELVYETEIIDENKMAWKLPEPTKCNWRIGKYLLRAGAASNFKTSKYGIPLVKPFVQSLEEKYSIVSTADLTELPTDDILDNGSLTYVRALQEFDDYIDECPEMNNQIQIVPKCEVNVSG